jgi:hypothetical protein
MYDNLKGLRLEQPTERVVTRVPSSGPRSSATGRSSRMIVVRPSTIATRATSSSLGMSGMA